MKNRKEAHEKRDCESKEEAKIKMGDHHRVTSPFHHLQRRPINVTSICEQECRSKEAT